MIGFISGIVVQSKPGKVIVSTATELSSPSVGYQLQVPQRDNLVSIKRGEQIELYVHTHVREDALDLFGFVSEDEKELFLILNSVNGIGPKVALALLSAIEPATLVEILINKEKEHLTEIPGIGKKTAERMVLELSDKLKKRAESEGFFSGNSKISGLKQKPTILHSFTGYEPQKRLQLHEAKMALLGLGFKDQDATRMVACGMEQMESLGADTIGVEDLIKQALKQTRTL